MKGKMAAFIHLPGPPGWCPPGMPVNCQLNDLSQMLSLHDKNWRFLGV